MTALDHLVFAVPDLEQAMADITELTSTAPIVGGSHPGAGTRNALLSFDDDAYFEIIAIDPDQPEPVGPRPFGVDGTTPARMAAFAVHPTGQQTIEDLADRMRALGFDPGPVTAMSRRRPDGVEIHWRLTRFPDAALGQTNTQTDGIVPFAIDWGDTPTPARSTPRVGRLVELHLSHPEPTVIELLNALEIRLADGEVVIATGERALAAKVELPDGRSVVFS